MATVAPLIVIVGPTASGKSSLAVDLAERFNGEIVCADSRTIYTHLSIGTAKPSAEDQARVPHWGIDLVEPGEAYSVADFQAYAVQKIQDIRARGKVPFLVGGSGLYVDAVILEYQFGPAANPTERSRLEAMTIEQLVEYCTKHNIPIPNNSHNKRYIIRAIEQKSINTKRRSAPVDSTIVVGIATDTEQLKARIVSRAKNLFAQGMLEEALAAGGRFGWDSEAMTGNIYRLARRYQQGELSIQEVQDAFIAADWQLARRQRTWFKRHDFIHWLPLDEADRFIAQHLA